MQQTSTFSALSGGDATCFQIIFRGLFVFVRIHLKYPSHMKSGLFLFSCILHVVVIVMVVVDTTGPDRGIGSVRFVGGVGGV